MSTAATVYNSDCRPASLVIDNDAIDVVCLLGLYNAHRAKYYTPFSVQAISSIVDAMINVVT